MLSNYDAQDSFDNVDNRANLLAWRINQDAVQDKKTDPRAASPNVESRQSGMLKERRNNRKELTKQKQKTN